MKIHSLPKMNCCVNMKIFQYLKNKKNKVEQFKKLKILHKNKIQNNNLD